MKWAISSHPYPLTSIPQASYSFPFLFDHSGGQVKIEKSTTPIGFRDNQAWTDDELYFLLATMWYSKQVHGVIRQRTIQYEALHLNRKAQPQTIDRRSSFKNFFPSNLSLQRKKVDLTVVKLLIEIEAGVNWWILSGIALQNFVNWALPL